MPNKQEDPSRLIGEGTPVNEEPSTAEQEGADMFHDEAPTENISEEVTSKTTNGSNLVLWKRFAGAIVAIVVAVIVVVVVALHLKKNGKGPASPTTTATTPNVPLTTMPTMVPVMAPLTPTMVPVMAPPVEVTIVETKLWDSDELSGGSIAVAIDGDKIVVSGPASEQVLGSLLVYTHMGDSWSEQAQLVASNDTEVRSTPEDHFGAGFGIDGDTIAVGAYYNLYVYLYVFKLSGSTWLQQAKLTLRDADDADVNGFFAISLAINGDTIVATTHEEDPNPANPKSVSAFVFHRNEDIWAAQTSLAMTDADDFEVYENEVAIDGDTFVVGARRDDDNGLDSGSAIVYTRTETQPNGSASWTEQAKLTPSDGATRDLFGNAVAIDGDTIVVGCYLDGDKGFHSGSVYVFTLMGTTWAEQAKLVPQDGAANNQFGGSVAIDGDTIVVGAAEDDTNGMSSGSAYVFTRTGSTWTERTKLLPSDGSEYGSFGSSVAISGDTIVVGGRGGAYVIDLTLV